MSEYKVHIDKEQFPWETKVYLRRADGNGRFASCTGIENGHLVFKEYEPGQIIEPLFTIPLCHNDESCGILQAFAQELTRLGIKPPENDTEKAERELSATKYHLEDMRKIALKGV